MVKMPRHDYCCSEHGKFEVLVPIGTAAPKRAMCPVPTGLMPVDKNPDHDVPGPCGLFSPWVPPTVSFPGGPTTGARPPYIQGDDDA